jgi:putative transposase
VHLNPPLTKVWARRGDAARVPAAGDDKKLVVFGAWNHPTERLKWQIAERKDSERFVGFLRQLLEQNDPSRRLILVMDNAGYHRANRVKDFFEEQAHRLETFWLPTYSPELNQIEYVWGYLKAKATNNYFFGQIEALRAAVAQACDELNSSEDSPIQVHFKTTQHLRQAA